MDGGGLVTCTGATPAAAPPGAVNCMDQGSTLVLAASAFIENACYLCRCGKRRGRSGGAGMALA